MTPPKKTVVITGASRGLGAGMARWFIDAGYQVGLSSRGALPFKDSNSVHTRSVDVRDPEALKRFVTSVEEKFGSIDLWINNAGVLAPIGPLRDAPAEELRTSIETNVLGVLYGSQVFVQHLHRNDHFGVLLNISSGAGSRGYAGWTAYCAGKSAVDRLTEALSLEESPARLRAHSVAPGVIDTEMQAEIRRCDEARFPMVEKFHALKANGHFNTPGFVAQKCSEVAFSAPPPTEVLLRLPNEFASAAPEGS